MTDEDGYRARGPTPAAFFQPFRYEADECPGPFHDAAIYWDNWHLDRRAYLNDPPGASTWDKDIGWIGGGWWPP